MFSLHEMREHREILQRNVGPAVETMKHLPDAPVFANREFPRRENKEVCINELYARLCACQKEAECTFLPREEQ